MGDETADVGDWDSVVSEPVPLQPEIPPDETADVGDTQLNPQEAFYEPDPSGVPFKFIANGKVLFSISLLF